MESWNLFESGILLWIQDNLRTQWGNDVMVFLSWLNNSGRLAILSIVILLLWCKYRHVGVAALLSLLMEALFVNVLLKNIMQRPRPYAVNEALVLLGDMPKDFSFPSGHTGAAFAVATVMFLAMPRRYGVLALVVATLIAVSRLYNGAHYPSDVIVAMMIAVITGIVAWKLVASKMSTRVENR